MVRCETVAACQVGRVGAIIACFGRGVGTTAGTATSALMIDYQPSEVGWMCSSATVVAHLTVPYQVQGLEQGAPVTLCQLSAPLPAVWVRLRQFS